MSARTEQDRVPLVAVISTVPLLSEALAEALQGIAEVRDFPAGRGDTAGLLRWLQPDAILVDSELEAEAAGEFARGSSTPLVRVCLQEHRLKVFSDGAWTEPEDAEATPEAIRNILVGALFGRRHAEVGRG
jgi:hypothetical protein